MPESTLSLTIDDLKGEIGAYLGYGRGVPFGEPDWDVRQTNNILSCLKSGLSNVYAPPPLTPQEPSHNWSFLRPFATLILASGKNTVQLPDGFGGFEGPLYISAPQTARNQWELRVTHEGKVQQMYAMEPNTTGAPRVACEKHLAGTGKLSSTRSVLYVWPTADTNYTLAGEWKHLPDMLTGSYPYPPGGAEHAELFKASVLAAAELQLDEEPGSRQAAFLQRLAASIYVDRKRKGPFIGYNGDRPRGQHANRMPGWSRFYDNGSGSITYNGTPL